MYNQVYASLKCSFNDKQHGFLTGRSTTSNLILANDFITKGMNDLAQVDVIYTDYRKCFDRIDHCVLMTKLAAAGIHGDLYRWFCSYIDNRSQAVVIQGYISKWSHVPSGVPQGSLLGPLLFTIFINDVGNCFLNSKIILYADDMKIFKIVQSEADVRDLQDDLNRFEQYCFVNKLDLNVSKCFHMIFTCKKNIVCSKYILKNCPISVVTEIKDLGIIHDSKLLFDKHIDNIVKKANKMLGFIMRTSSDFRNLKSLKILYCTYVRSQLEYASQVWNPQYEIYKSRIESIQQRFLRYLDYKAHRRLIDYECRCKHYHFLPLTLRRNISDIVYIFKIANGLIDCAELLSKLSLRTNLSLRPRSILYTPTARTNFRQNSFIVRAVRSFNSVITSEEFDLFCTNCLKVKRILSEQYFNM